MSKPLPVSILQALVEAALTLADEYGRWDRSIHLNNALIALDGAGQMPPKAVQIELGWSPNHAPDLH